MTAHGPGAAASGRKLTLRIGGRRTTMRLSAVELEALERICAAERCSVHALCTAAVNDRASSGLNHTQRVRDALLQYLMDRWPDA